MILLIVAAPALCAWTLGYILLRRQRVKPWHLALSSLAALGLVMLLQGLEGAFVGRVWIVQHLLLAALHTEPVAGLIGPGLLRMLPLDVPIGLLVAAGTYTPPEPTVSRKARNAPAEHARRMERTIRRESERDSDALGLYLAGELPAWQAGHLIVPPSGHLGLATLLIGAPGAGKSVCIHRLAYLAGRLHLHLVVIDAKGGHDGLALLVVANYLAGWYSTDPAGQAPRVGLFPQEPIDLWRGSPQAIVNRLVEAFDFSLQADYYRQAALLGLRLALSAPGPRVDSTRELVRRMDAGVLGSLWDDFPVEYAEVQGLRSELPGAHLRISNLAASLGASFDGAWSFEDVDLAVVTVPSMAAPSDADSAVRVLMADYSHFVMARKPPAQRSLVIVDEFSALQGGRRLAVNLLERARGAGAGIVLAGQSVASLGTVDERERLEAASAAQILFRTPMPGPVTLLAGTQAEMDVARTMRDDGSSAATYTERQHAKIDQDIVRSLPNGHAFVVSHGQQALTRIIRRQLPPAYLDLAATLVAGNRPGEVDHERREALEP
jgi:hypothetical protein